MWFSSLGYIWYGLLLTKSAVQFFGIYKVRTVIKISVVQFFGIYKVRVVTKASVIQFFGIYKVRGVTNKKCRSVLWDIKGKGCY